MQTNGSRSLFENEMRDNNKSGLLYVTTVRERRDGALALSDLRPLLNQPPRKLGGSYFFFTHHGVPQSMFLSEAMTPYCQYYQHHGAPEAATQECAPIASHGATATETAAAAAVAHYAAARAAAAPASRCSCAASCPPAGTCCCSTWPSHTPYTQAAHVPLPLALLHALNSITPSMLPLPHRANPQAGSPMHLCPCNPATSPPPLHLLSTPITCAALVRYVCVHPQYIQTGGRCTRWQPVAPCRCAPVTAYGALLPAGVSSCGGARIPAVLAINIIRRTTSTGTVVLSGTITAAR
jgi:hypothetical protein